MDFYNNAKLINTIRIVLVAIAVVLLAIRGYQYSTGEVANYRDMFLPVFLILLLGMQIRRYYLTKRNGEDANTKQ